ncbi:N-acetylmuramoyl-L-alanine amidase [Streptomyces sp. RK75]|uniref:N-acetylmuramoyl-L-alanine amidase n=1 Tax=Streptomyces sp. RK75 TaxID=2824895 RepID=UPI001B38D51D|nr:peptidoglycan recognition family protein [Streptomyces sp. RK75]MBQ0865277.1 N-acetylmuramoyl-L-alanine amidase [Streptomyces sp. RK75]
MGQAADEGRTGGPADGAGDGPGAGDGRGAGDGKSRPEETGPERGVARRRLLIASSTVVGLGVLGVATQQELKRWWWRMPGNDKPRMEGQVDDARARWVAAADGNMRRGDRPADFGIDRVVIHVTQGSAAAAVKVFRDPAHRAAAHYIVCQDGQIIQMIRELDVAFHAGNKEYNERSVGIEHEGWIDRPQDFTDTMYRSSARLTAGICARYRFPVDRRHIIGHHEVPGADHTDPGRHWDWDKYLRMVRAEMKTRVKSTLPDN